MKTLTTDWEAKLYDIFNTIYNGWAEAPALEYLQKAVVPVGLFRVARYPEETKGGWRCTTHNGKSGGIQLNFTNIETILSRMNRIINGKKEPLRMELIGYGNVDFNLGKDGLFGTSVSAGQRYRIWIPFSFMELYGLIEHARQHLIRNGAERDEGGEVNAEVVVISTGGNQVIKSASDDIHWAA